jgi:hypothetical protein
VTEAVSKLSGQAEPITLGVEAARLHYLYEAILAFNNVIINETALQDIFSFDEAYERVKAGKVQPLVEEWLS